MEFRRSKPERRQDRRICTRCKVPSGARTECRRCGAETQPRIRVVWYIDGKRYRELTHCWREQDAEAILRRKEEDYWRQQDLGVDRDVGGTLREAVDAFLATKPNASDNYRRQLNTSLNAFADGFGWDRCVTLISPRDINRYKEDGLAVLSSTSVRSYMINVRHFIRYLHDEGWIRRNPARKIKLPPAKKGRDHLRPEEVGPFLQTFWECDRGIAPIITMLALGGWRKGEVVNLRRRDTYPKERWAYVLDFEGDDHTTAWSPKNENSLRSVPLHPLVVRALEVTEPVLCPDGSVSPWVFPVCDPRKRKRVRDRLGRMQPQVGDRRASETTFIGDRLRAVLKEADIPQRVTVHGLRRTFAVLLQEAGAPDAIIRQALGHGARGVTETHYLPRRDDAVKRWVDAIQVSVPFLSRPVHSAPAEVVVHTPTENRPPQGASRRPRCPHTAPSAGANVQSGQRFA